MSTNISYDYPKATSNSSTWIPNQTYQYISHPNPCICIMDNYRKLSMRCTICKLNTTSNKCKCSRQHYILHEDCMRNNEVLTRRTKDTDYNNKVCQQEKGCSRDELRAYLNVVEVGYGIDMNCDHIISPKGYNKKGAYDFDMTLKQHSDFICHYKNLQLLTPRENSSKSSHNDPVEVKIVHEEFAKQTPAGDIHDILIARRKKGSSIEVRDIIAKEEVVQKEVDEETIKVKRFVFEGNTYLRSAQSGLIYDEFTKDEIGEWNATSKSIDFYETDDEKEEEEVDEEEEEVDEEQAELVREEAEIAKAKTDFAIQMAKREAEFKAKKARKEIKNKLPELINTFKADRQAKIDALLKEMDAADKGLYDTELVESEFSKLTTYIT